MRALAIQVAAWAAGCGLVLSLLAAGAPPACAQQPAPGTGGGAFTMGEIGRRASYGQSGAWTTAATPDGALVFTSRGTSTGWTASIVRPPALPYTVQVEVQSDIPAMPGRAVGAGLVFGFQRASGSQGPTFYTALVAGGTLYVYSYDGSFEQVVRSGGDAPGNGPHRDTLRVTVRQDGFTVSLNGNGSVSQSASSPLTGEVGVMASGEGEAAFRNLVLQ